MPKSRGVRVRVRDLPEVHGRTLPDGGFVEPIRPFLYCARCGAEYSATPGDYWNLPADHVFKCGECRRLMRLVTRHVEYRDWKQAS